MDGLAGVELRPRSCHVSGTDFRCGPSFAARQPITRGAEDGPRHHDTTTSSTVAERLDCRAGGSITGTAGWSRTVGPEFFPRGEPVSWVPDRSYPELRS